MKNLMLGMVVLFGSALTLAPGCGDDEANGGSGGAAGKGGSTSGKGGSQATGGDTGDAGAGNTSSGGDPGTGGTPEGGMPGAGGSEGGTPGAGGAGGAGFMNPVGCPEAAPATGEDCSVDLEQQSACEYVGSSCVCNGFQGGGGAGGAMTGNWICRGGGADCPAEAPVTDDMCNDNGMQCPYPGGVDCFCAGGDWDCVALGDPGPGQGGAGGGGPAPIGDCPEPGSEPDDGDECVGPIPNCLYPESGTLCHCPSNGPNADEWSCQ